MPTTVVLADSQPVHLLRLKNTLALLREYHLLCECRTTNETLNAVREFKPDVLFVSSSILRESGRHFLRVVIADMPAVRILVLSKDLTGTESVQLTRLGVSGVLSENAPADSLIRCLDKIVTGEKWIDEPIANRALKTLLKREDQQAELRKLLTPREIEIAHLAATGLRNKEIGKRLYIDEGTVKSHLHKVYTRLNVNGRYALARLLWMPEVSDNPIKPR